MPSTHNPESRDLYRRVRKHCMDMKIHVVMATQLPNPNPCYRPPQPVEGVQIVIVDYLNRF